MANIAEIKLELGMSTLSYTRSPKKDNDGTVEMNPSDGSVMMADWVNFSKRTEDGQRVIAHIDVALGADGTPKDSILATSDRLFLKECVDEDSDERFITICEMSEHTQEFTL